MNSQYYTVESNAGNWYYFYIDRFNSDLYYIKSTDKGKTWGSGVLVTGSITGRSFAVWYDRWSGISADLIHVAVSENGSQKIMYRTVNTASADALGTQRTPIDTAGTITTGSNIAMTITPNGYIFISAKWSTTGVSVTKKSEDAGVNWTTANRFFEAEGDYGILFPGFAADANDLIGIYWDISAAEISKKIYDWSAGTWSEVSIASSLGSISYGGYYTPIAAYCDRTNNYIAIAYWTAATAVGGDLKFWHITESSNTSKTDVATDYITSTSYPVSPNVGITYNSSTSTYYIFFGGDATTEPGLVKTYYRTSSDAGTTWSSNTLAYPYKMAVQGYASLYASTYAYPTPLITNQNTIISLAVPTTIKKINGVSPW